MLLTGEIALALTDDDPARFCSAECISDRYASRMMESRLRIGVQRLGIEGSQDPLRLIMRIAVLRAAEKLTELPNPTTPLLGR